MWHLHIFLPDSYGPITSTYLGVLCALKQSFTNFYHKYHFPNRKLFHATYRCDITGMEFRSIFQKSQPWVGIHYVLITQRRRKEKIIKRKDPDTGITKNVQYVVRERIADETVPLEHRGPRFTPCFTPCSGFNAPVALHCLPHLVYLCHIPFTCSRGMKSSCSR